MVSGPSENFETIKQWGIKAIGSRTIDEITQEMLQIGAETGQKLTNGQMIERIWDVYKFQRDGGTLPPQTPQLSGPANPDDILVSILSAGGPWTEHNPMPGELRKWINRIARGSQPGLAAVAAPSRKAIAGGGGGEGG